MTPPAWIALVGLAFTVFLAVIGVVIWLVRLESKTGATADACRATAEALAAHAKAQALVGDSHRTAVEDIRLEIVRAQEQIKHLTSLVERWLVPARTASDSVIKTIDPVNSVIGAGDLTFIQLGTGAVSRSASDKMREHSSILDRGGVADFNGSSGSNNRPAFTNAATRAAADVSPGRYLVSFSGADVVSNALVAMEVTTDRFGVSGEGAASDIYMDGITVAQLNAGSDDPLAAGGDAATVINFTDVDSGNVRDLRITGTYAGTGSITVGKARAKGVGVMNSRRLLISGVTGGGIAGNIVNLRGNGGSADTSSSWNIVDRIIADQCGENGVNLMGGTYYSHVSCISRRNAYHGLESSATLSRHQAIVGENIRYGVATSGNFNVFDLITYSNTLGGFQVGYDDATHRGEGNLLTGILSEPTAANGGVIIVGQVNGTTVDARITSLSRGVTVNSDSHASGCTDTAILGPEIKVTASGAAGVEVLTKAYGLKVATHRIKGGDYGVYDGGAGTGLVIEGVAFSGQAAIGVRVASPGYVIRNCSFDMVSTAPPITTTSAAVQGVIEGNYFTDNAPSLDATSAPKTNIGRNYGPGNAMVGEATWVPTIADGAFDSTNVTVAGALPGDTILWSYNADSGTGSGAAGVFFSAHVLSVGGGVRFQALNMSGVSWTPPAGSKVRLELLRRALP